MHGTIKEILFRFQVSKTNSIISFTRFNRNVYYLLFIREIKIQFLSDPEIVFRHCANKVVNYEDPYINISMPIFSIHGNHDDPSKKYYIYLKGNHNISSTYFLLLMK